MKKGLLYFHQGWTDISLHLPLINYYSKYYDFLKVIIRKDAKKLVNFYKKPLKNVEFIYIDVDEKGNDYLWNGSLAHLNLDDSYDNLFHGQYDILRSDNYRFASFGPNPKGFTFYAEAFYEIYGISFNNRIDSFEFERDQILELEIYKKFIDKYGEKYILYHDDENYNNASDRRTKINFLEKKQNYSYVNLNKISEIFFDYIKVFENAEEIHLIDSIWGCLYYQIDAKYELFKNKNIYAHPQRGHIEYFTKPFMLKNWSII